MSDELKAKRRTEWLVDELMEMQRERDDALDKLNKARMEIFSLETKLKAVDTLTCGNFKRENTATFEKNTDIPYANDKEVNNE